MAITNAVVSRPILWGFFVCTTLAVVFFGIALIQEEEIKSDWHSDREQYSRAIETQVTQAFEEKVRTLINLADEAAGQSEVLELLRARSEQATVGAFEGLRQRLPNEEYTIDVVDPRGSIVAWAGRSITSRYENFVPRNGRDSFAVILQSGLHTFLSVGIASDRRDFYIVASRPLELQYPISNRFVNRVSFAEELMARLKTDVWIALNRTSHIRIREETRYVHLKGLDGTTIGYVFYVPDTLSSLVQKSEARWMAWVKAALAIGLLFFSILFWEVGRRFGKLWWRLLLVTALTWGVRLGWRFLDFPSLIFGGSMYDATLYAASFYFGFASNIGEVVLSTFTLCFYLMTVWSLLMKGEWKSAPARNVRRKTLRMAAIFGFLLFFVWSVRGFAEAFRSFVFDSTLQYHDPSVILPDLSVTAMHVSMLFLTISLLVELLIILGLTKKLLADTLLKNAPWWTTASLLFVFAVGIFNVIDRSMLFPIYFPLMVFVVGIFLREWIDGFSENSGMQSAWFWRTVPVLVIGAFLFSSPMLDWKLHDKERQRVELYAENLLRPMDSWFSYVLVEGLRTVGNQFPVVSLEPLTDRSGSLAFSLWAQTLMSREGYNSAVVLYDEVGHELSRFAVGVTAFEQREILTKVFDGEEEIVQVSEGMAAGGGEKIYGIWSTIRNEDSRIVGSAALMLSTNQRPLLRDQTGSILRTEGGQTLETSIRELSVSEFQEGTLIYTTLPHWYRGMKITDPGRLILPGQKRQFFWRHETIGGKEYENLYAMRNGLQGRVVVVSLQALDLKWHVFNLVKVFFIYAIILILLGVIRLGLGLRVGERPLFGFRKKLVLSFGILGLIPLFLLGYYNREVASERADESIKKTLSSDLNLVEQRIQSVVLDEEDFYKGVNDDFCEAIAPELGVDFAVFRRGTLQSSSKPELFQSAILDSRLPGGVFAGVVLLQNSFYIDTETIGRVQYAVGYKPLYLNGRLLGILSVPALYRQKDLDEDLAERNAFVFGSYALAFSLTLLVSVFLANRLSRPLRDLRNAVGEVGRGNLEVTLKPYSSDEIGELAKTFNTMVRELKRNREELNRAERETAWKEMAKQVAHEIRNPLTPMKLSVQHLRQAFKDKVKDREVILQEVAKTLIEQIDTLSRIATEFSRFGRMPTRRFERIDVQALVRESISLFRDVRGIEFTTKFSDTAIHIVADGDELRRVFVNLLRNSVQAMSKGGQISVETRLENHQCIVRISDTGAGIPLEIQQKVFEPNFSTKTGGMGLGLAISQKTIRDLGGAITFTSEVGKGTTFEIVLPYG